VDQVHPRRGVLILLCGLPGSGKTTTAKRLSRDRGAVRLCPDEWIAFLGGDFFDDAMRERVEELQWRLARDITLTGGAVIIESGHWLKSDRDTKRDWARGHDVGIELIVLDVPIEERWRRLSARNAAPGPASVPLTMEVLQSYEELFQMPNAEEQGLYDPRPDHARST
jgi:predicted kinase